MLNKKSKRIQFRLNSSEYKEREETIRTLNEQIKSKTTLVVKSSDMSRLAVEFIRGNREKFLEFAVLKLTS